MKVKINGKHEINIRTAKTMRLIAVLFIVITVALSGCVEDEQNNTTEEEYTYDMANVENIDILTLESFPVQINVIAEGYLPDGCTEINEIKTEKEGNNFNITLTTKRPKDAICTQAIESFRETIPLKVQGLSAGNYTVNVNGVNGSFELAVDNILEETPDSMPAGKQVITESGNGTNITLENEETFYLKLRENPTTGYEWELNLSQGLSLVSDEYESPESEKGEHPLVGAGGVHVWEIKADSEGTQQVTAVYRRSWENETGTENRFTLNVEVV
jgi:inhibitor of cysteine peptidase